MLKKLPVLLVLLGSLTSVHSAAQPVSEPTQLTQVVAAIQPKPKWQGIEIIEERPKSYRLQLNYKPTGLRTPIVDRSEAAADATEIARVALAELVKEGKDPAKDRIFLAVVASQEAGKGPTGKPLTRRFGSAICECRSNNPHLCRLKIPQVALTA
jgi:hypothetical protein